MPKCENFFEDIPEMQVAAVVGGNIFLFRRDRTQHIPADALRSTVCLIDAVCTGQCGTDEEYCGRCGYRVAIQSEREVLDEMVIK
jgi:hypothetical protein